MRFLEWGGGGEEERGGEVELEKGAKIGWLMFYDTWSQLIYAVSCTMGRGRGGGKEGKKAVSCIMGRQGGDTGRVQRLVG